MPRVPMPARRRSWTQKARIGGQTFYCSFGEYEPGKLGEIFLEAHKEGSFSRGILTALARTISLSLQSGAAIEDVVKMLRSIDFPPNGKVEAENSQVTHATSIVDWIAQEIEIQYIQPHLKVLDLTTKGSGA